MGFPGSSRGFPGFPDASSGHPKAGWMIQVPHVVVVGGETGVVRPSCPFLELKKDSDVSGRIRREPGSGACV